MLAAQPIGHVNRSTHTPESDVEYTRRRRSIDGDVDAEFIIIYLLKNENGSASERAAGAPSGKGAEDAGSESRERTGERARAR